VFFSFAILSTSVLLVAAAVLKKFNPSMVQHGEWNIPDATRLPRLAILAAFTIVALGAVHLNTIVHPFILADNRHYTFYVFRLLLRHPLIKYFVTPIYVACGWLCLSVGITGFEARKKTGTSSISASVILIWLLTTAATLATAPLVEPRYFIVPWIVWRLNLHIPPLMNSSDWDENQKSIVNIEREALGYETNWSIMVNLAVIYVFLFWRFEWPHQPGHIMRFMW
jgi:alpha-1,2-glucosyltransferase